MAKIIKKPQKKVSPKKASYKSMGNDMDSQAKVMDNKMYGKKKK